MRRRSSYYRKRGPDHRSPLKRGADDLKGVVERKLDSYGTGVRIAAGAAAIAIVAVTTARRRVGLHPAGTLFVATATPLAAAVALPHGRLRCAALAAGYMYAFKVSWELPYDDPDRLRRRLLVDEPIRFDTWIGRGVPPGVRLQRALRTSGEVSPLDVAVTAIYGSWFLPHAL